MSEPKNWKVVAQLYKCGVDESQRQVASLLQERTALRDALSAAHLKIAGFNDEIQAIQDQRDQMARERYAARCALREFYRLIRKDDEP